MVFISSKSQYTILDYGRRLEVFCAFCEERGVELEDITPQVFKEYLGYLSGRPGRKAHKLGDETLNHYGVCTKVFLRWCSTYEDFFGSVKPGRLAAMRVPKKTRAPQPYYTQEETTRFYAVCKQGPTQFIRDRDRAVVGLLIDTGIRASGLCDLLIKDVYLSGDDPHIIIRGKGGKISESALLGKQTVLDLVRYKNRYRRVADQEAPFFLSRCREKMKRPGLTRHIRDLKQAAGIEKEGAVHNFRRSFATHFMDEGGDLYDLQEFMDHSHISTTLLYVGETNRRKARKRYQPMSDRLR